MYTVGIYDKDYVLIKPLRIAETYNKGLYLCDYYKAKLCLTNGQQVLFV